MNKSANVFYLIIQNQFLVQLVRFLTLEMPLRRLIPPRKTFFQENSPLSLMCPLTWQIDGEFCGQLHSLPETHKHTHTLSLSHSHSHTHTHTHTCHLPSFHFPFRPFALTHFFIFFHFIFFCKLKGRP